MNILFFHPLTGYVWRGIERNVVSLASSMVSLGHDASILTVRHRERALYDELHPNVRLIEAPYLRYYTYNASVPFFSAHLMRRRYDAVIACFGGFGIGPSVALARLARRSPLYLFLGYPIDVAPHRYDEIERWGLDRRAAGIWAHGEHVAAAASRRFGRDVVALPTGVDPTRFRADPGARVRVRAELGLEINAPVILTVAALEERKGIHHVLEALPSVRQSLPDVQYVVAGGGGYAGVIESHIDRLNLGNCVRMLGPRHSVEELYQAVDVFCLMARGEAGPIVAYEALASGLPVVALHEKHLETHLGPDVAVLLANTAPKALAESLIRILSDPARRAAMGGAGRRLVRSQYSYDSLALHLLRLIESDTAAPLRARRAAAGREE